MDNRLLITVCAEVVVGVATTVGLFFWTHGESAKDTYPISLQNLVFGFTVCAILLTVAIAIIGIIHRRIEKRKR